MLYLLISTLIGGILILLVLDRKNTLLIKQVSLIVSILVLFESILIWVIFDNSVNNFQFLTDFKIFDIFTICFGIDSLNLYFILLTTVLTPTIILASWENIKTSLKIYIFLNLLVELLLLLIFSVLDIFNFYVFFEAILIPLFILVGYWGGSSFKIRATFLIFLYTLIGSLLILISILVLYLNFNTLNFNLLKNMDISHKMQIYLFFSFIVAFLIKSPVIPFHIWLPRAHAEAPLAGSIVLAGTVLKTAIYGFLRISISLFPVGLKFFYPLVFLIFLISLVYSSLSTLRQTDTKVLIAYSSITHISVILLGLFSNTIQGIEGSILFGIAHGFVSPGLFVIVGGVLYDRYFTRIIKAYSGLHLNIPILSVFFFVFTCFNIGVPLSLNWLGEFICLLGVFKINIFLGVISSFSILFSACYGIWFWSKISGGIYSKLLPYTIDVTRREFNILALLTFFTLFFGIYPNFILDDLHFNISEILYSSYI